MIEAIQDFVEDNAKNVGVTLIFWIIVLVALWIIPAKMGMSSSTYSEMTTNILWFEVGQMFFTNLMISALSLPIIFFIIMSMTRD